MDIRSVSSNDRIHVTITLPGECSCPLQYFWLSSSNTVYGGWQTVELPPVVVEWLVVP